MRQRFLLKMMIVHKVLTFVSIVTVVSNPCAKVRVYNNLARLIKFRWEVGVFAGTRSDMVNNLQQWLANRLPDHKGPNREMTRAPGS